MGSCIIGKYVRIGYVMADFHSAEFSGQTEINTIKDLSRMTFYSNSKQQFILETKDFQSARKILLSGNQPLSLQLKRKFEVIQVGLFYG